MCWRGTFRALAIVVIVAGTAAGQLREYELILPESDIVSRAERTERRLAITEQDGKITTYTRVRPYDSEDGNYLGYYSPEKEMVIRWPVSDRGHMLIAKVIPDGLSPFRPGRMEIHTAGKPTEVIADLNIDPNVSYRLTTRASAERNMRLESHVDSHVLMRRDAEVDAQLWHLVPVGGGFYRLHSQVRGPKWSLSCRPSDEPRLEVTDDTVEQLWRITRSPTEPDALVLRTASRSRDRALSTTPGGRVIIAPFENGEQQFWTLEAVDAPLPIAFEEYTFLSHELHPAEALPVAEIELYNSHSKELWVLIADVVQPANSLRLRIPPGESQVVKLERDPGGELVEVFENHLPGGVVEREQFVTLLPPAPRYDVSVYEVFLQSVAIDRTVPGGRIEDVNYSPRSLGWFDLGAGPDLANGSIDVYEMAKSMENPGAVRRIDPKLWQQGSEQPDPVEQALDGVRN